MIDLKQFEVWFITGSQHLYGDEVLQKVDDHAQQIAKALDAGPYAATRVVFKPVVKTPEEIYRLLQQAGQHPACVGIITWMHTFSPAKMWIGGLKILQKPLLHLHTQFNRDIPWSTLDMDFMNLNQSAHGDREFGFMLSRMRLPHKIVVGHWQSAAAQQRIDAWMRAACAWHEWQKTKICRFGDNMREVAVTEGDKVEAQLKLGFSVSGYGVAELANSINEVSDTETNRVAADYENQYRVADALRKGGSRHEALRQAARIEAGLRRFLQQGHFTGFTDTFEDLHGLEQLPGIAVQRLMAEGYGFGAEGDWKTAALLRAMKIMGAGRPGGTSFMEDYTYHLAEGEEMVLGAHMLEVCASIAMGRPSCEIHPLSIGGRADPVRLVFNVAPGPALNASVVDMGDRFRLLVNEVEAMAAPHNLERLPVARALWKPMPDFTSGCAAWLLAGGAHHTCYSQNVDAETLEDFADMAGVEFVLIDRNTNLRQLKKELSWRNAIR
jgi:L-arabinose isomerase